MNLLNRNNDLEQFFWPIIYFAKQQILENHQFPLWNNLFFAGTPLLLDPQSPLFYPPNIIFLILPIDIAFLISFLFHILLGGIGMYLTAKNGFGLSRLASIFTAALYITAPKIAGHLEAGHFGLVNSFAWIPFVALATLKITKSPSLYWSGLLAIGLAGLFFTHILVFSITVFASVFFFIGLLFLAKKRVWNKNVINFGLGGLATLGLTAITLLPQFEWKNYTTRFILLQAREVYPNWNSATEFFQALFWPWQTIHTIDTEKWLALGLVPSLLAIWGFVKLKRPIKTLLILFVAPILILATNNISPVYTLLLSQDWYVLLRIATRPWFLIVLVVTLLAGYGFDSLKIYLRKPYVRHALLLIAILAVSELIILSWLRISKPVQENGLAPKEVYKVLRKDKEHFRVFCTTRCLAQKDAAEAGIELVDGYGTLQQTNFYKHSWQLMGAYWNHYTLSIPPTGTYKFEKPQPDAASLGRYNTKYVISTYKLTDENFMLSDTISDYLIYENKTLLPRAYFLDGQEAPITDYRPNYIRVDTSLGKDRFVLAEVWSPGWTAYLDGHEAATVQETPNALRLVDIKPDTKFVDFKYEPESFKIGRLITGVTVLLLLGIFLKRQ